MPSRPLIRNSDERGIAMITTLLVLMLMSALLVGFTTVVMSDQRYRFIDRDRGQAFYAASAGVEKLTADIGNLFLQYVAPTYTQVQDQTATPPAISGITFSAPQAAAALPASQLTTYHCNGRDPVTNALLSPATKAPVSVGGSGYTITFCKSIATGNPTISDDNLVISGTSAYSGMTALQSPYQIDVTAKTATGGEVHLVRTIQSVAIPVFQFGIFSDSDLSFSAVAPFSFGGRIHTNGNLFLAQGSGATLTSTGKITAVGDVVRQFASNGTAIGTMGWTGTISLATSLLSPTGNRGMAATEGSVTGMPGSSATTTPVNWTTLSNGGAYYNGFIKTTATGAKRLTLPLTATGIGGANIDVIRRPCAAGAPAPCPGIAAEDTASILYNERLMVKASIRILLSDTSADITNLPGVTATAPIALDGDWRATPPAGYGPVDATHPPIARSMGQTGTLTSTTADTNAGDTTITVGSVPAIFRRPTTANIWFKNAAGLNKVGPIVCNGYWTATTMTGCGAHLALSTANQPIAYIGDALGNPITIATGAPGMPGGLATATLNAAAALNSATITITAASIGNFSANTFFLNDVGAGGDGRSWPITCTGYNAAFTQFTGCTGVVATQTGATVTTGYVTPVNTGTIGGFIKIERSSAAVPTVWTDVTAEILKYGIGYPDSRCNIAPSSIVMLQRPRESSGTAAGAAGCAIDDITNPYEWWPNALFDTREGMYRDQDPGTASTGVNLAGTMYYVAIDVKNLAKWFKAQAPYNTGTGSGSRTDNGGYTVYFSDRRSNRNAAGLETAEYGWEDFVNPGVASGAPNATCELPGEDVNGNGTCETYGSKPSYDGAYDTVPGGALAIAPLVAGVKPSALARRSVLQVNRALFFRRALKLINGGTIGSDATVANRISGLTVVSENPVYIQGDWNAAATFLPTDLHAATAIIADAVTLLSNNWTDNESFNHPYDDPSGSVFARPRSPNSYYRVAILGGKPPSFLKPSDVSGASSFGQDGGAHNFLRMLEHDTGGGTDTVNYRGSMASLYFSRQAVGTFKGQGIVYSIPVRNFSFDTDFVTPALLPPNTPMFRDMNVIGFSQELRPGR